MSSKFRLVIFRVCSSQGAGHCPLLDYPFKFLQVHTARSCYTYTHIFQSRFSVLWNILCMFELFVFISELLHNLSHHFTYYDDKTWETLITSAAHWVWPVVNSTEAFILSFPFSMLLTEFSSNDSLIQSLCVTPPLTPDLHQYGPQASVKLYASGLAFNFIAETGLRPHSPKWWNRSGMTAKN